MRERGLKATACNSVGRAINSFLTWSQSPFKIAKLKEPDLVLPTFTAHQVLRLVNWKPKNFYQRRLHSIVLTLLDSGMRIDECLSLRVADCDFNDLLFTVTGKGRKQRRIPISLELRRTLVRYIRDYCPHEHEFLFATRQGKKLGRRVVLRDVKLLCQRLGFDRLCVHFTASGIALQSRTSAGVGRSFYCRSSWGIVRCPKRRNTVQCSRRICLRPISGCLCWLHEKAFC